MPRHPHLLPLEVDHRQGVLLPLQRRHISGCLSRAVECEGEDEDNI